MDWIERFFRQNKEGFDQLEVDDQMWQNLRQALDEPPRPKRIGLNRYWWLAAAAVVVLSFGIGWWVNDPPPPAYGATSEGFDLHNTFPDIALRNPEGELIPLSSLKGKLVLVEFWASYSKVCTEEHCFFFKPIYNEFKDKGFEIYAVSIDSSAMSWIEAIERDELDWVNVSDLDGHTSPMAEGIDMDDLPMTFLLDSNGRIIAKDIDASELKDTLNELLAFSSR